jgi:hypothetical protein
LLVAHDHGLGVEADRRVVDEHAAVDLADVDRLGRAVADRADGVGELERHREVLREVVERAEREHGQRHRGAGEPGRHGADGAVPSPCDHGVEASRGELPCGPGQVSGFAQDDLALHLERREGSSDLLGACLTCRAVEPARGVVQKDSDTHF